MKRMWQKGFTLVELMVVIAILGILATVVYGAFGGGLNGCGQMSKTEITQAVEKQGYVDVEVGECSGWASTYGCSEDDSYACEFRATNAMKQRVDLIACTGAGDWNRKGVTIRSR